MAAVEREIQTRSQMAVPAAGAAEAKFQQTQTVVTAELVAAAVAASKVVEQSVVTAA